MQQGETNRHLLDLRHIWNALIQRDKLPQYADFIVIGGCRDAGLAQTAAKLYHSGVSKRIITTGYQPKGMEITEAELLADECIRLGVPEADLILEKDSSNTGENITFSARIIKKAESVILIHKPYMSLRFLATAQAQWPNPQPTFYTICEDITFDDYTAKHSLEDVAYKMLGDFRRMEEYATKGFQSPQLMPTEAQNAYIRMVESGFITR